MTTVRNGLGRLEARRFVFLLWTLNAARVAQRVFASCLKFKFFIFLYHRSTWCHLWVCQSLLCLHFGLWTGILCHWDICSHDLKQNTQWLCVGNKILLTNITYSIFCNYKIKNYQKKLFLPSTLVLAPVLWLSSLTGLSVVECDSINET